MTEQNRFGRLLKAMTEGEAPSARKESEGAKDKREAKKAKR